MAKFLLLHRAGQEYNEVVEEEDLYDVVTLHWKDWWYGAIRIDKGKYASDEEE